MNSSEIQLIDCFIGEDNAKMNLAMTKLFFAPKGQVMGRYQKAAFDAIQRKFNGDRYASVSVREKYETAMSVVYPKLIEILRKEKASYVEQNKADIDSMMPSMHWTCNYDNFASWLSTVIEREANRNRPSIDALLGLKLEIIVETNYDDGKKTQSTESEGADDLEMNVTEDPDAPVDTYEAIMGGNQSESIETEGNAEIDSDTETEDETLQDGFVSDSSDENESSEQKILIAALYDAISNLKSGKDKDIILTIMIGGVSEEDYAMLHNLDIDGLYRDYARAKARLIVNMVQYIQQKNKSLVRKYLYLLEEKSASLVYDVIVRGISFSDAAISRDCRVSDIQARFSAAYSKIIKEHNHVISEDINRILKEDKKLKKAYAKYKASLIKCGAMPE